MLYYRYVMPSRLRYHYAQVRRSDGKYDVSKQQPRWPPPWKHARDRSSVQLLRLLFDSSSYNEYMIDTTDAEAAQRMPRKLCQHTLGLSWMTHASVSPFCSRIKLWKYALNNAWVPISFRICHTSIIQSAVFPPASWYRTTGSIEARQLFGHFNLAPLGIYVCVRERERCVCVFPWGLTGRFIH
jgi:hypothetical protein